MDSSLNRRVAVIGGGLSGLATAAKLRLADPSIEVTLFESQARLGGVIYTEKVGDFLIDHGADMFATEPRGVLELCQQLGIADHIIAPEESRRGATIVHRGKLVPLPEGFVLMRATQLAPMLKTPLLSLSGKLRFLAERWISQPAQDGDESVESFVRRRMGQQVLDRLVAPLVAGIYTADISKLSMQSTMGPLAKMVRDHGSLAKATSARRRSGEDSVERISTGARYGQFRAFQSGMYHLIEGLAAVLPSQSVRLTTPVRSFVRKQQHWQLQTEAGVVEGFQHVVVATPPRVAGQLLKDIAPTAATILAAVESASTAIVVLGVQRADVQSNIDTFGFVVPPIEKRKILAGSFASHKFAGRAPDGQVLIRCFIGGALQPELLELDDDQLVQIARTELAGIIGLTGEPLVAKVVRWNNAMPQYHVGHADRVRQIEASVAEVPNLWLVSNVLHGVGIAPVIQLADRTATDICARLSGSPRDRSQA